MPLVAHLRSSSDTTVKAALFEDSAAMAGLALAALGLLLRQLTGSPVPDGVSSIAIGALLVVVAVRLGLDSRDLLLGRPADAARVAVSDDIDADTVERLPEQTDRELPERLTVTPHVFIDPTDTSNGSRGPMQPAADEPG